MLAQITKLTDKGYLVNGKAVYLNEQGIWIPEIKFNYSEIDAFKKYLKTIENGIKVLFRNIDNDTNQ